MKIKVKKLVHGVFIILLILGFSSCHNLFNDDDDQPETIYLTDYELVKTYTPIVIEASLNAFISKYPDLEFLKERAKYGFKVYKIQYKTSFKGEPVLASGIVSVPIGEEFFPSISYQNGTNTLHANAPSVNPNNNELYLLLEFVASTGFVVSMPDYLGFGSSDNMFHPYLHKESTVQVVLDMLRAVEELATLKGFSLNEELYLTGYSQGGWATMQVQKAIENEFSGEFNLKASAPAGGPYDLNFINEYILNRETYPMPYFFGYMFDSYTNLEAITTPIDEVFNSPYNTLIPVLYDGTKSGEEINAELTTSVSELFTANYRQNYKTDTSYSSILSTLSDNSIEAWNTSIPTRIIHGTADSFVPMDVATNIYQSFLTKGVSTDRVQLVPIPETDHIDGIIPAGLFSIQWFLELTQSSE
ncbi:hypothetical protein D1164_02385 [Mariniphaga sediminis]|uniref:Alpha/beta fold hydrolase n=1 Tax=Mariniphaga sediminis TaxID=1628158 RepID=A0A399D871_9BACT|nr:lipase family protein [Mariniphaga sediminis]RIH64201.1 hypothetical protein D1164_15335 [Mariniphaga sediminis]RIH66480.1 hypothetical protein D1164_02385 [Mariniphaga sediminis]